MKKTSLLIVSLLIFVDAESQIPFAPLGAKWYYQDIPCDPNSSDIFYHYREVTIDSIIQGKNCTLINSDYCPIIPSCEFLNYVYQEGDKVFIYDPTLESFQILYDFSLQAGELYYLKVCYDTWGTDSITATIINNSNDLDGEQEISIHANQPTWWNDYSVYIKKGVGNKNSNPLLMIDFCVTLSDPCFVTSLACYETAQSGVIIINGENCISAVDIEGTNGSQINFYIYPNPVHKFFTIQSTSGFNNDTELILSSTAGQIIKKYQVPAFQNQSSYNVEDLSTGLYFWNILQAGNLIENGKLIIIK